MRIRKLGRRKEIRLREIKEREKVDKKEQK